MECGAGAAALGPIVATLAGDAPSARRTAAATAAGGIAVDAGSGLPLDQVICLPPPPCVVPDMAVQLTFSSLDVL